MFITVNAVEGAYHCHLNAAKCLYIILYKH